MSLAETTAVLCKTFQPENLGTYRGLHRTTRSLQYVAQCQSRIRYQMQ